MKSTIILLFLILDSLWLKLMYTPMYMPNFQNVQNNKPVIRTQYALLSYGLICLSLFYICFPLFFHYKQYYKYSNAIMLSYSLTGFIIYGVYNCTNLATFNQYKTHVGIIDTIWGAVIYTIIGIISTR